MQLQAGFILSPVHYSLFNSDKDKNSIESLLNFLCYFNIHSSFTNNDNLSLPSIFTVADNLISRGLPTFASIYVEEYFLNKFNITEKIIDDTGRVNFFFKNSNKSFSNYLYEALHIIDPTINLAHFDNYVFESEFEKKFFLNAIPEYYGYYILQKVEIQREILTLFKYSNNINNDDISNIENQLNGKQRVDFSIEFPYPINNKKGLVIEIDGEHHLDPNQILFDKQRDRVIIKAGWAETIRIPTLNFRNVNNYLESLNQYLNHEFFQTLKKNYEIPLWNTNEGKLAMHFTLVPFAIARIQKVLLHSIKNKVLNLEKPVWKIAIIERDLPCADLAINDFNILINHLFTLEGENNSLPKIELTVLPNPEFNFENQNNEQQISISDVEFDLLIDISNLSCVFTDANYNNLKYKEKIMIRSSLSKNSERAFNTNELIMYKPIVNEVIKDTSIYNQNRLNSLQYFLQSIFRKNAFRPGQLEIINRTLQLKSVVGLLPTGSGKSLTYQISALLQPGITLVVDPIKSLMKDQYYGLLKQRIDCGVFINSSLKTTIERKKATEKLIKGNVLFTFISPERLQIKEFRDAIDEMYNKHSKSFSYCVIDEVHCVSEWGHDFRTSYLRLGKNAKRFCKIKSRHINSIPLIGLTATASFDVLSDVQRELMLTEDDIIGFESADRPELIYKIYSSDNIASNLDKKTLGLYKQKNLLDLLKNIPQEFDYYLNQIDNQRIKLKYFNHNDFYSLNNELKNTGLIFCPHKTWVYGVKTISNKISNELNELKVGTFVGSSAENEQDEIDDSLTSEINQDKFVNNELDLLVATKAFGMGIDKQNIRFTIHFNYPNSIESFYQEAGRAGRDGRLALCYILYDGNINEQSIHESFHNNSFKGPEKEKTIVFELLNEINFSPESNLFKLSDLFENEYGENIHLNLWPKTNPKRLYVNKDFKNSLGYIDINTLQPKPDRTGNCHLEILTKVINLLNDISKDNLDIRHWLTQSHNSKSILGIEKQLLNVEIGKSIPKIVVGFSNGIPEEIASIIGNGITDKIVNKASNFCNNTADFIARLENEYFKFSNRNLTIEKQKINLISSLFFKIRNAIDTFKAVYRLSIIGVIDDYSVDYNSKTITLLGIKRKPDEQYIENLYNYIRRYVSKSRAEKVYSDIHKQKGNTIIQKSLGYLIDFVYSEIAKKRKQAIIEMRDSCAFGANNPDKFKEYLALYFNSKYYSDLRNDTNYGRDASFEIVIKYLQITEGKIDNFKHLRGAVIRLLIENPENYSLLLLKCFTLLLLESSNKVFISEIEESFLTGFKLLKNEYANNIKLFIDNIYQFTSIIISFNDELKNKLQLLTDRLLFNHHYQWLKEFNKKFKTKYG